MADDLGKGLLPLYGAKVDIATPNIDRLARAGFVFDNAWATPLCITTRTELVIGQYPVNNGIAGHPVIFDIIDGVLMREESYEHIFLDPLRPPSFAHPLKTAGYATALAGKRRAKPTSGIIVSCEPSASTSGCLPRARSGLPL